MRALCSCWLWCLPLVFATVPLHAEDHDEKPPSPPHAIADGTTFLIRLEDKLDVSRVQPGKRFKAKLEEDMMGADETKILHGARIRGHISAVGSGFHPRLLLSFDEIETQRGWTPLIATITAVPGEHGLTIGDEGEIEREGQASVHHDPDSDGISSRAGTAAAVVRTLFSDHRLQLRKGTILEVRLDRPLRVPWR
jgi:hypothetical protein